MGRRTTKGTGAEAPDPADLATARANAARIIRVFRAQRRLDAARAENAHVHPIFRDVLNTFTRGER